MILEKMNLEEVINPHYAFPIVGVILCALLVFAFGFKTPVQPPSFDFEEHRKATSRKKQKSKEKLKVVQNGSTPQPKVITTVKADAGQTAAPIITSPATEKQNSKNDVKTKAKKSATTANQQPVQPEVKQVVSEDINGGQWTQQLSKKDRKNRKKEEPQEAEKIHETKSKAESSPSKAKNKTAKEEVSATDKTPKDAAPLVVESKTKAEVTVAKEQREPKKKVAKAEEKVEAEATTATKSEPPKGRGKKEKKIEEAKVTDQPTPAPPVPVETKPLVAATIPVETEKSSTTEKEISNDTGSSNVAFDELGDMWQDSKPQKKKKKARRE